ncbi:centrosome-associated protein CEP250-like [Carcharodon carcharias]|uniref:centrosome-associated protein CEP250-like n=1 Tax=Carcharodon carcharias TaxID=13397 RepID=UPI001B7E3E54|nr:centrosome-associated protein CEP250-like [Carcharodon carcharias]
MAEQTRPTAKVRKGLAREGRRTARRRRELRDPQSSEADQLEQEGNWSSGERFMIEKVHEFFQECGGAERGFITQDDMQKLQEKFSFSPEELEVVFNKLDVDGKGCLTPEVLTRGLSHFLTDQNQGSNEPLSQDVSESLYQSQSLQHRVEVEDEEKQHFAALMERLGANTILQDKLEIWKLWVQLRRNEPNLLGNLEDFLSKVTVQIQEAQSEKEDLERTLKKRTAEHNTEVQRLYEEMELQINNEKERIESENIVKLHTQSQDLQKELDSKQEEVQHLAQARTQVQAELVSLRSKQDEAITEIEMLKLNNEQLESRLEQIQQELQEAQDRLVAQQEEAAHLKEKEGERDQPPSSEGLRSSEADPQIEVRQRKDSDTSQGDVWPKWLQSNWESAGHVSRIISIEEEPLPQQALEDSGIQSSKVTRQEVDMSAVKDGEAVFEEKQGALWSDGAAGPTEQVQAELVSLRSKQDEGITEIEMLKLTNQQLESQLEQIQQELQEAQDRLVAQQEKAAHREEKEGEWVRSPGSEGWCSNEADPQLQAELVFLRSKQEEAITENEMLKLTNQELESQLEQIQQELQEAQDRLVAQQEEAAHRKEKEGEWVLSPWNEEWHSDEANPQAELVSLRSKQDEAITEIEMLKQTNQQLESRLEQIQQEAQDRLLAQQEEAAHREEKEGEQDQSPGSERRRSDEADPQVQAELVSLRSKQDEAITEIKTLKLTNQELESRLEQIQLELQEAQDRLVAQQEEAAHREEKEGEQDQSPGSDRWRSIEADPQVQAELVSLRSKQDEAITEIETLKLTNQELESRLEQIQQELQESQDRLVAQQEEAAHREEKGGDQDQSPGSDRWRSIEADPQVQAELVSLRSKLDEAITESETLKLTNQELESRLEQIQQELQESQDRLVAQQEEAAHREEKEGDQDQSPGSDRWRSVEADPQVHAELVSLRRKQDEAITEIETLKLTNQELGSRLEQIQQELQEARDQLVAQQEEAAHREEKEGEQDQSPGSDRWRSVEADPQVQAELVSLRSKQDEAITEIETLKLTNQELESRLEQIQQELQEAQDRLVAQQEEAAHREEKEGEQDQSPGSDRWRSVEADPQVQAELVSLRSKQDEAITEIEKLKLTNQELESRLEQIQKELQEAQDRLVAQQVEAAHREENEGEQDQSPSSDRWRSIEADPQVQVDLVSLCSKQDEAITEIETLKLTNQELERRLEQIQKELQEAQDRLVAQQEEAAHREEKEGEQDQSPGIDSWRSIEADPQVQAELVSLRSKQDEAITEIETIKLTNQELESRLEQIQQELQEAQDRLVAQQEEAAHREEKEGEQDQSPGIDSWRSVEADPQVQAELVSLRSKQDEAITEIETLKLTNQELESRLEQIQQELQEAQDRLVAQQEEAAHREEKEGEQDQSPGSDRWRSVEADPQVQAELVSLRSKQDEAITEIETLKLTNQELESRLEQIQQELQEAQDRLVAQQEEAAHREEKEGEQDQSPGSDRWRSVEADPQSQVQAELVSLRSKQDEAITEIETLKLTNQELESRLEQIQQELQEAQDRLVAQQEEAAHREEKEGEQDQSPGSDRWRSVEADPQSQVQAELVSLRSKQDEAITEIETLKLTNQELESRLEQIQQELQESQHRLVASHREEKEVEQDQSPGSDRWRSVEAHPQVQAELVSLRSKQDEAITEIEVLKLTNQELERRLEQIQHKLPEAQCRLVTQQEEAGHREEKEGLQRTRSIQRRVTQKTSGKAAPLGEDPGLSHLRVECQDVTMSTGDDGDGVHEETETTSARDGAAETIKEVQAELVSLRSKQDEAITENEMLKLTSQQLESRLEQIQQELQEAQDRLVAQQEELAQREEKEGDQDQSPRSEGPCSDEADPQVQAELVSLRSKQDEAITEIETLKLTNQELESRLEQIQQELQEAQDRLVAQQEEAAHREEKEGLQRTRSIRRRVTHKTSGKAAPLGEDPGLSHLRVESQDVTMSSGDDGDGVCEETETTSARDGAAETIKEVQAELISLRSKQDEAITENEMLKLTNQQLESRLEQIQQELQEAQDRLVAQQEEAAHREEKEGEQDQSPGSDRWRSVEADPQVQAELVSLRSKQDEAITEIKTLKLTNQELESQLEQIQQELQEAQDRLVAQQEEAAHREEKEGLQRTHSVRRHVTHKTSGKAAPLGEDPGLSHPRIEGQDVTMSTGDDGDGVHEETETTSARDGAAETIKEVQAELVSLRSKQDEAITENEMLKLTNQQLESRLEQIQQELQEAQDRLVAQQEEAAHREEKEGIQRTHSIQRHVTRNTSSKAAPLGQDPGLHLRVEGQDVTMATGDDGEACEEEHTKDPDHLYNIMFVGSANAGKTSFIQRFYDNNFDLALAATVGIDYRVKTLTVDDRHIALQLWDTAGQERFHSVTRQFFRKADGVIVMYDITSSSSFADVHYWLACVKDTVADDVVILLLGNKMDDDTHRQVPTPEGERLAQEYNILFYECSACTGHNISAPMVHLGKLLKHQEEKIKEIVVKVVERPAKKGKCCT